MNSTQNIDHLVHHKLAWLLFMINDFVIGRNKAKLMGKDAKNALEILKIVRYLSMTTRIYNK